jgi:hypothetical protein
MTPELEKEIIVGVVSAFFTALFTGVPAALLFWWTWKRDQERLRVQKLVNRWKAEKGGTVFERDSLGPTFGILIRNRSLFSVHLSAVGFKIDGQVVPLDHPQVLRSLGNHEPSLLAGDGDGCGPAQSCRSASSGGE